MRAFSSTLIAELRKEVFSVFWLIEIPFSQAYPTRYIDIDIDIHHNGNRYFAYPFKVGDITYTSDMAIDSVNIEVANADLSMSALLLGSDVGGTEATISFGCLDSNYQVLGVKDIFYGEVSGWKILKDKSVELTVVNEFMLWSKKTLRIAQASCPWPFKGTLSDGLVGYWPLDEGSGAVARDKTQNGNDGAFTSTPLWQDGISGKCLYFDGIDDIITVPHHASLNMGINSFSVSFWVNYTTGVVQQKWLMGKGESYEATGAGWAIVNWSTADPVTGLLYLSDGVDFVTTTSFVCNRGTWYHICFVIDKTTNYIKVYQDAVYLGQVDISAIDNIDSTDDMYFGTGNTAVNYSDCKLDEIRLYKGRVLSQDEITSLYNNRAIDECHYGGVQTWCDKTYARCTILTNQDNFGGFRFLPYIMEKEIWWGGPKPTD